MGRPEALAPSFEEAGRDVAKRPAWGRFVH